MLAMQSAGPRIFGDETLYFRNARSLAEAALSYNSHFPPAYPTVLAPAFLVDGADPYRAALIISAIVGATVVPAAYWLARTAGARWPIAAGLITAVLVGSSAYSQNLMSEALGVPLVLLATTLALRGGRTHPSLMGGVAVLLCLTKYLYIPLAVALLALWWWTRWRGTTRGDGVSRAAIPALRALALVFVPFVGAMLVWLAYAGASGSSITGATGVEIVRRTSSSGSLEDLVGPVLLWLGLYLAYLIVAFVPALLVASWLMLSRGAAGRIAGALRSPALPPRAALLLAAPALSAGYIAIAVRHSLGAGYNQPEPDHYMGRYLMHVVALLAVAAVVGLDLAVEKRAAVRGWRLWAPAIVTVLAVMVAFAALFGSVFDQYSDLWGMSFKPLSPDIYSLAEPFMLYVLVVLVVASTALVAVRRAVPTLAVWILAALLGTAFSIGTFFEGRGATAHKIADAVHAQPAPPGRVLVCLGKGLAIPSANAVDFWELNAVSIAAIHRDLTSTGISEAMALCKATHESSDGHTVLILTSEAGDIEPTLTDDRWGARTYIFAD